MRKGVAVGTTEWREKLPFYGKHPFPPEAKKCIKVDQTVRLPWLIGERNKMFVEYLVSTDRMHSGIFRLAPNSYDDPSPPHKGDELFYVLQGSGVLLVDDEDYYLVHQGEAFYLPAGHRHQWFNCFGDEFVVLWVVAPEL